ncbi:MAG: hypothetical protein RLZZ242_1396 [Bacteroidota bacterium]|jgi:prephenate dehydratase
MKVAIQGIAGSNHHKVAVSFYGAEVDCVYCDSFAQLADHLNQGLVDEAVMAIENSIAGALLPNYALIYTNGFKIVSEYYLSISHNLMALKGQTLQTITRVESHPMALLQCATFFEGHKSMTLVEADDTASVAKRIAEGQREGVAAIAPPEAASLYHLEILARDIQTMRSNATRFVRIQRGTDEAHYSEEADKASMRFVTGHKRGSLATLLNVMSDCNLNLTKIQSLPIIETPWKYAFFVDVTFEQWSQFQKAVAALEIMAESFILLGVYKNGLKSDAL